MLILGHWARSGEAVTCQGEAPLGLGGRGSWAAALDLVGRAKRRQRDRAQRL